MKKPKKTSHWETDFIAIGFVLARSKGWPLCQAGAWVAPTHVLPSYGPSNAPLGAIHFRTGNVTGRFAALLAALAVKSAQSFGVAFTGGAGFGGLRFVMPAAPQSC